MSIDGSKTPEASLHGRLRKVLRDALQVDDLPAGLDVRRNDLEAWDSISHLRLMIEIEQEFGVTLDDQEFVFVDSLGKIAEMLRRQGVAG